MIYELRIYTCLPGRLPAQLKRAENVLPIWERLGIRQAGFWTVVIGEGFHDMYYMLAWESLGERERKWSTFVADQEWISLRSESERDGPILANIRSSILRPTPFSSAQ